MVPITVDAVLVATPTAHAVTKWPRFVDAGPEAGENTSPCDVANGESSLRGRQSSPFGPFSPVVQVRNRAWRQACLQSMNPYESPLAETSTPSEMEQAYSPQEPHVAEPWRAIVGAFAFLIAIGFLNLFMLGMFFFFVAGGSRPGPGVALISHTMFLLCGCGFALFGFGIYSRRSRLALGGIALSVVSAGIWMSPLFTDKY